MNEWRNSSSRALGTDSFVRRPFLAALRGPGRALLGRALEAINLHPAVFQRCSEMIQQKLNCLVGVPAQHGLHDISVLVLPLSASAKLQAGKKPIAVCGIEQLFADSQLEPHALIKLVWNAR